MGATPGHHQPRIWPVTFTWTIAITGPTLRAFRELGVLDEIMELAYTVRAFAFATRRAIR
ncbi:hypothetical protein SAMN05446635_0386 [Burkholderia sp. OK233]|nr:hypothetical protein SAMN05446635_0386 [Burkholderia sp. OK233]